MQWPRRATCLLDRRQGRAFTIKVIPCNCKTQNVKERSIAAPPRDSSQPLFDIGDWLKTRCVIIIIAIHQSPVGPIPGDRIMVQGRPTDPSRYAEHDARCPPLRTAPDEPAEWKERWSRRWLWSGLLNVFCGFEHQFTREYSDVHQWTIAGSRTAWWLRKSGTKRLSWAALWSGQNLSIPLQTPRTGWKGCVILRYAREKPWKTHGFWFCFFLKLILSQACLSRGMKQCGKRGAVEVTSSLEKYNKIYIWSKKHGSLQIFP